jgi:hypothetical protein
MRRTGIQLAGLVLGSLALWGIVDGVFAQSPGYDPYAGAVNGPSDWQQRVLKRSQPAQPAQWHAAQAPAASYRTAQRPSYAQAPTDRGMTTPVEPTVRPRHWVTPVAREEMETIPPGEIQGEIQYEPVGAQNVYSDGGKAGGCASCGRGPGGVYEDGESCDVCGGGCPTYDAFGYECFDGCLHLGWLRNFSFFAGGHGFKGPRDRNENGNFGLQEGLNFAAPLGDPWGWGYQIGANAVQSNFSGTPITSRIHTADRRQYFVTAGLFHRAEPCGGFQYGVAFDYMHDSYDENVDLKQIRSESGYVIDDCYEIGYYGAYGVSSARLERDGAKIEPTDMFVLYLRHNFENGGDGRIWGGATAQGDGLLGADLWVPLGRSFALENSINYLIPKQGTGDTAQPRESWGLTMQLVWYPGRTALCQQRNPYRPLFKMADNSLFMVERSQ